MLHPVAHGAKRTIFTNREHGDGSGTVVGNQEPSTGCIDLKMAWSYTATGNAVDRDQFALRANSIG